MNCPEGAREATLGCVGFCPPRNDVFFRHRRCRRAILESPLQIELLRRKKGPPLSGRPRCLEMFFPIRRAETVRSVQRRITRVLLVFRQATCRTVWLPALPGDWSGGFTRLPSSTISQARVCPPGLPAYLAYSTALVSRMTLTLIWPGYSSSASIFLAMSRARRIMLSSLTTSGLTMMRISRPAWMA